MTEEIKKLISDSKNICLIPSQTNEPESLTSCLALFYTLKELNKNVNPIIEDFPEKLNFLVPSLDFISSPKDFIISIPKNVADVSQIYYEKNEENLKIHLTVDKGNIKKEDFSFYFSDTKPDLVITLGIQDFSKELANKLDSFGFILDAPIINIDNNPENIKFGKINIIENKSISEMTLEFIYNISARSVRGDENLINKDIASCILAGLIIYYENFKSEKTTHEIFQLCTDLIKKGASHHQIANDLHKMTPKEVQFIHKIFQNIKTTDNYNSSFAILDSSEFHNFGESDANFAVEKIKTMGFENNLLVLWQSHASDPTVKGFFYSKKPDLLNRIGEDQKNSIKNGWVFLSIPGSDINVAKDEILKLLS